MTTCLIDARPDVAGEPVTKCPACKRPWSQYTCGGRLRTCPIVASEDSWDRGACPMTGKNECPSDGATQAQCPQC